MPDFLHNCRVVLAAAGAATGTTAIDTSIIDTHGYDGIVFIGSLATANAGNYVSVSQGTKSDGSDMAALEGTKVVPTANGDSFAVEVRKPGERYVRATITRTAATITGDVYAILYGPLRAPVTQGATIDSEIHLTPDEGTV